MKRRVDTAESDAYAQLYQAIASGALLPNERLVEQDVVDRFGLTRPAVRTALIRLAHDGLVVREPNRGARVRLVSELEAVEILETRAAIESLAARHAAVRATPADTAELIELADRLADRHAAGDLEGMSDLNERLHRRIVEIARHETIARLDALLTPQLVRFQYRTILQPGRADRSLAEHRELVAAIAAGDGDRAEHAMRAHLTNVADTLSRQAGQPRSDSSHTRVASDITGATPSSRS